MITNIYTSYTGPAPKLSCTPGQLPDIVKDLHPGEHTIEVLQEVGYQQKVNTFIKIKNNKYIIIVLLNT